MKILIVTERIAGSGHEKAARSLAKAINNLDSSHTIKVINLIPLISETLEEIIKNIYMLMITRYPYLWHWIYKKESRFSFLFKEFLAYSMMTKLKKLLNKEKPEMIIATHASGLGALSKLKTKKNFILAAVFTDYTVNSFWINDNIDYYFVGHESFKEKLVKFYQVQESKVFISGIPIDPVFAMMKYKMEVNSSYLPIQRKKFEIIIMGGGLGLGGIKDIIISLNQNLKNIPLVVTVVTGSNQKLFKELNQMKKSLDISIIVLPYIENIFSLMRKADLLISKPGGLTISEALSIPIPILIYKPIPGQEERNAKFLIKMKAAIQAVQLDQLQYWIQYLYNNPKLYIKLKQHGQIISKPDSSSYISEMLLKDPGDEVNIAEK